MASSVWWEVKASAELASSGNGWTELSSNGNGAGAAGRIQSPNCRGNSVSACDFATLGRAFPHGTRLIIFNPANGRRSIEQLTDVGNGSSFGPAIGLTPTPRSRLGISTADTWSGVVHIALASGDPLNVVGGFGTPISGPGGSPIPSPTTTTDLTKLLTAYNPSTTIRHDFFQLGNYGGNASTRALAIRRMVERVKFVDTKGPGY